MPVGKILGHLESASFFFFSKISNDQILIARVNVERGIGNATDYYLKYIPKLAVDAYPTEWIFSCSFHGRSHNRCYNNRC